MRTPNREPVGQAVNAIIMALVIIAKRVKTPNDFDEIAAEEAALWTVKSHVEWILSYIKTRQEQLARIRVVQ